MLVQPNLRMIPETPLFDHTYEPPQQPFPTTAAGLAALIGATPFAIFPCNEGSGTTLTDSVGSKVLTGAGTYPILWGTASGFYNGADMHNRPSPCLAEESDTRCAITDAAFDHDATTSIGWLIVRRMNRGTFGQRMELGWDGGLGLSLQVHGVSGFTRIVYNGLTSATITNAAVADYGWSVIVGVWNKTTGRTQLWTSYGSSTAAVLAGAAVTGGAFALGDVTAGTVGCHGFQPAYLALFRGAQAEALGASTVTNFWRQADVPSNMTYTRASSCFAPDTTDTSFGERVIPWGTSQVAYGAHPSLDESPGKTGIFTIGAKTNLLVRTLEIGGPGWTSSNMNRVDGRIGEGPSGAVVANQLRATAANGTTYQSATTVASTQYTFSVYLRSFAPQGTATSGFIRLHDGASVVASTAFTTTTGWKRWTVSGSHAGTTTRCYIEITTNNESVEASHVQLESGWASPPISAYTTTKSRVDTVWYHPVTALDIVKDNKGSMLAQVVGSFGEDPITAERRLLVSTNVAGNNERMVVRAAAGTDTLVYSVDDEGATLQEATTAPLYTVVDGTVYKLHLRWNSAAVLSGGSNYTDYVINKTTKYVDGTPDTDGWNTGASATTRISPGHGYAGGSVEHGGMISRLVIYAKPQPASKDLP